MHAFVICLLLQVIRAAESIFPDWSTETNNFGEPDIDEPIATQSDLYEDPFFFTNEDSHLIFDSLITPDPPLDLPTDNYYSECPNESTLTSRPRRRRRQGTMCSAKQNTQRIPLLQNPTLKDIEAQIAGTAAAGNSNQLWCPPFDHPEAAEAVCSSGNPGDEAGSFVFLGASTLTNCERRECLFSLFSRYILFQTSLKPCFILSSRMI